MSNENESENEQADPEDAVSEGVASDTDARHWLTNDILAGWLVGLFPLVIILSALGWVDLSSVPEDMVLAYIGFAGIAVVWAFGSKAARLWFERKAGDE